MNLLPDAERLATEGWVDASAWGIAHTSIRTARKNLERYMRGETGPSERGELIGNYVEAWEGLQEAIEHEIEAAAESGDCGRAD